MWRIDDQDIPLFMDRYSTTVTIDTHETDPTAIVKLAYGHFVREPLRTFARDEAQRRNDLEVKDALIQVGAMGVPLTGTMTADAPVPPKR